LGWVLADKQNVQNWVVILLEDGTESAKLKRRFEVTSELIGNRATFHRVQARGQSLLARMFSLTLFGDFVSLYLAALNQVDPEDITWINVLKGELAKIG
jgi:glucose/mannose-6-phosphate isomerase